MSKYENEFCMHVELCAQMDARRFRREPKDSHETLTDSSIFAPYARDFDLTPIEVYVAEPLYVAAFREALS